MLRRTPAPPHESMALTLALLLFLVAFGGRTTRARLRNVMAGNMFAERIDMGDAEYLEYLEMRIAFLERAPMPENLSELMSRYVRISGEQRNYDYDAALEYARASTGTCEVLAHGTTCGAAMRTGDFTTVLASGEHVDVDDATLGDVGTAAQVYADLLKYHSVLLAWYATEEPYIHGQNGAKPDADQLRFLVRMQQLEARLEAHPGPPRNAWEVGRDMCLNNIVARCSGMDDCIVHATDLEAVRFDWRLSYSIAEMDEAYDLAGCRGDE